MHKKIVVVFVLYVHKDLVCLKRDNLSQLYIKYQVKCCVNEGSKLLSSSLIQTEEI